MQNHSLHPTPLSHCRYSPRQQLQHGPLHHLWPRLLQQLSHHVLQDHQFHSLVNLSLVTNMDIESRMSQYKGRFAVEQSLEDEQIEERTTACTLSELLHYPTVELDPKYNFIEDCYEIVEEDDVNKPCLAGRRHKPSSETETRPVQGSLQHQIRVRFGYFCVFRICFIYLASRVWEVSRN